MGQTLNEYTEKWRKDHSGWQLTKRRVLAAAAKDESVLRALLRDGIAEAERARETLGTTTPGLDAWLARAKAALS